MFRKSRTDQAKAQVQEAATSAGHHLRDRVAPAVGARARDAKDWATPRVERGLEAAAPKVEAAVDKVSPAVDAARDKIVDDLLPRLVEAVNAAAAAGAHVTTEATEEARSRGGDAYAVLKGDAVARPRRRKRRWLLLTALAAAVAAGVAVFKRQTPKDDPWAVAPGSYPSDTSTFRSSPADEPATDGLSASSAAAQDAVLAAATHPDEPATGATDDVTVDLTDGETGSAGETGSTGGRSSRSKGRASGKHAAGEDEAPPEG